MLIPFGVLSAAGSGGVIPSEEFELLESVILTGTQATITFSNLDAYFGKFKHLQLRTLARSVSSGTSENGLLRFNGDTGANYSAHYVYTQTTVVPSGALTSQTDLRYFSILAGTSNATGIFSPAIMDIADFSSSTKNKTTRMISGGISPAVYGEIFLGSGAYLSTSPISSISLSSTSSFATGSRFSLYGLGG
jgi:hypothetical protein